MNLTLIFAGILVLLNPGVWLVDFIPDLIGAFLIIFGIRRIAFLNEPLEELYRRLWLLMIFNIVKIFLAVTLYDLSGTVKLVSALIVSVAEIVILVRIFTLITSTLDALQMRYCDVTGKSPETGMLDLGKLLSVYTVIRVLLGFFPQVTELMNSEEFGSVPTLTGYVPSTTKWVLYALSALVSLAFMVFVIVKAVSAFRKYRLDSTVVAEVTKAAKEKYASDPNEWYTKKLSILKFPFFASVVFSIYVYIDGVDYFPKMIAGALMLVLVFACTTNLLEKIVGSLCFVLLFVASFICEKRLSSFYNEYPSELSTLWSDEASRAYLTFSVFLIIQAFLLLAMFLLMWQAVRRMKLKQFDERSAYHNVYPGVKKFKRSMLFSLISFIVAFLASVAYPLLRVIFPEILVILVFFGIVAAAFTYAVNIED